MFVDGFQEITLTSSDIANPHVLWADSATAVVIYVWTGAGRMMNRPFAPKIASTVWTKRGDKWFALYHHESDAPTQ